MASVARIFPVGDVRCDLPPKIGASLSVEPAQQAAKREMTRAGYLKWRRRRGVASRPQLQFPFGDKWTNQMTDASPAAKTTSAATLTLRGVSKTFAETRALPSLMGHFYLGEKPALMLITQENIGDQKSWIAAC